MTESIEALTTTALSLALDAASMRQQAIAANIANANTPGYQPIKVNFETQLEDARRALESNGRLDSQALSGVTPRFDNDSEIDALSPKVRLDVEVANMSQNAVQYQALLKGLSKHYAILSTAVNDGRK